MPIRRCSAIIFLGCFLLSSSAKAQWNPLNPVVEIQQQPDGALLTMKTGVVKLQVCTDVIVRVLYSPAPTMPKLQEYVVTKIGWPQTNWAMQSGNDQITLTTPRIKVTVTRKDGNILFADATGKKLFEDYGRTLTPVEVNGEKTYRAEMFSSLWGSYEAFAGAQRNAVAVWSGDVNSD